MSTLSRLGGFLAAVAASFVLGYGLGIWVGPLGIDPGGVEHGSVGELAGEHRG